MPIRIREWFRTFCAFAAFADHGAHIAVLKQPFHISVVVGEPLVMEDDEPLRQSKGGQPAVLRYQQIASFCELDDFEVGCVRTGIDVDSLHSGRLGRIGKVGKAGDDCDRYFAFDGFLDDDVFYGTSIAVN